MRVFLLSTALLATGAVSFCEPPALDGAKFSLETMKTGRSVPFSLPYAGPMPENPVIHAVSGGVDIKLAGVKGAVVGVLPPNLPAGTMTFTIHNKDLIWGPVAVEKRANEDAIDVRVGGSDRFSSPNGEKLTTYYYKKDDRKPYLWPLLGEGGASMTRDWPVGSAEGKSKDHPHHVSFWTAHGDVGSADFWEYGDRTGWQQADKVESGSGAAAGWIASHDTWIDKDKKPVVAEDRTYIFYNTPAAERLMDVSIVFTAKYGDVKFGDTKEGGIVAFRMNDDLREQGGTGKITTSEGAVGEKAAWGKPAAWCDYSGTLEGFGVRGIAVMDSPRSFRYPVHWHVRGYGLMGANPFGYHDFYNGTKNGEHTLPKGETLSFAYRVYIHSGDAAAADVAGHYKDFANPPKAEWQK